MSLSGLATVATEVMVATVAAAFPRYPFITKLINSSIMFSHDWFGIVLYINKLFVINEKYNFLFKYL